jgi:siroheme synthase
MAAICRFNLRHAQQRNSSYIYGHEKTGRNCLAYTIAGKGDTPAAIIQHASLPNQKSAKGKVSDLVGYCCGPPAYLSCYYYYR